MLEVTLLIRFLVFDVRVNADPVPVDKKSTPPPNPISPRAEASEICKEKDSLEAGLT